MASRNHLIIAMLLIPALTAVSAEENPPKTLHATSFHDVLRSNGLPIGLFPKAISDFSIDVANGRFRLRLQSPSPCDTVFETRLRYERDVAGSVSYGRISDLTGVFAQELFLWLPVRGIQVDIPSSGLIYFDVAVVSKQFSLSIFETHKDCQSLEGVGVGGEGRNDVVLMGNDRPRISKDPFKNYTRKRFIDREQEQRAVS